MERTLAAAAAAAKSLQSCLTLCDPIDGSPPGSSVHGIFQARVLEWGAIAFSERTSYSRTKVKTQMKRNRRQLWLQSHSQLGFSLTSFFLPKLFIPFITTTVLGGMGKQSLYFFSEHFLLPCCILCWPQGQYELGEPRAACTDCGSQSKKFNKIRDLSWSKICAMCSVSCYSKFKNQGLCSKSLPGSCQ